MTRQARSPFVANGAHPATTSPALSPFRCPDCGKLFGRQALALGSTVEVKCNCNETWLAIETVYGTMVVNAKGVVVWPGT